MYRHGSAASSDGSGLLLLEGDDIESYKCMIKFMMDNNLIQKNKTGRYYSNGFKFDDQTRSSEYGTDFEWKTKMN